MVRVSPRKGKLKATGSPGEAGSPAHLLGGPTSLNLSIFIGTVGIPMQVKGVNRKDP